MTSSSSTSAVITTLSANAIFFGVFVGCFLLLRTRYDRIYCPRALDIVSEESRVKRPPRDPFSWLFIVLAKSDKYIFSRVGLDSYLFLRFLRVFGLTFFFGILTWVVLFPVNASDRRSTSKGFDILAIGAVKYHKRYYAHALMGWVYYGVVIFVIYRELFFYNSLRCAVLSTPRYAKKLSSRTVLFQGVPDNYLDRKQFFKLFSGVKRIYIARESRRLAHKVQVRQSLVNQLENAESKLIRTAVKAYNKALKKGKVIENPSDIDSYVPRNKRPRKGLFKKVDIIEHCMQEIPKIDQEVKELQRKYRKYPKMNSIFVEFEDQYTAQLALQTAQHHNPSRMTPAFVGIEPGDVHWLNLRLFWWERLVRRSFSTGCISALIIFWAIPVAFVGLISNITYLTNKLHWLRWINNMPSWLLGVITGLLPTIMLTLLNTFLPIFIRYGAKVAGNSSAQHIELYTQKVFFIFMLVNTFLVTAFASSATSVVTQIISKPEDAMSLLAQNLPKSSNFFISYIVLQGLTVSSSTLGQVVGWIIYYVLGALFDSTPRKKWARYSILGGNLWGTSYPLYTLLAAISLAYCIISPLILFFVSCAFFLLYIAYAYTFLYVSGDSTDLRGLCYPRALLQLFSGIYIGQIALLGIFIVGKGWGPVVLQAIGLGFTIFCHMELSSAFNHLMEVLPTDCMKASDGVSQTPSSLKSTGFENRTTKKLEKNRLLQHEVTEMLKDDESDKSDKSNIFVPLLADRNNTQVRSNNFIVRFFRPDFYLNFAHCRDLIPSYYYDDYDYEDDPHAYDYPDASAPLPGVWIPKDPMGVSAKEVELHSKYINISDENAGLNKRSKIIFTGAPPV